MMQFSTRMFYTLAGLFVACCMSLFVLRMATGCSSPAGAPVVLSADQVKAAVEARRALCAKADTLPAGEHADAIKKICALEEELDPLRCRVWPQFCSSDAGG